MDTIIGGTISHDGVVNLYVDADKVGYAILPNKSVLATTGGTLESINTGIGGRITFYFPKNSTINSIKDCEVEGEITYSGDGILTVNGCDLITSLVANSAVKIAANTCTELVTLFCKDALEVDAPFCSNLLNYDFPGVTTGINVSSSAITQLTLLNALSVAANGCLDLVSVISPAITFADLRDCNLSVGGLNDFFTPIVAGTKEGGSINVSGGLNAPIGYRVGAGPITYYFGVEILIGRGWTITGNITVT